MSTNVSNVTGGVRRCIGHDFIADSSGEVTCSICGVLDDEMPQAQAHCVIESEVKPIEVDPYAGIGDVNDFE